MKVIYSARRSRFLLNCAESSMSYEDVSAALRDNHLEGMNEEEWSLWIRYYHPLACSNPLYKHELIYNNRTLSWFARNLATRFTKTSLS